MRQRDGEAGVLEVVADVPHRQLRADTGKSALQDMVRGQVGLGQARALILGQTQIPRLRETFSNLALDTIRVLNRDLALTPHQTIIPFSTKDNSSNRHSNRNSSNSRVAVPLLMSLMWIAQHPIQHLLTEMVETCKKQIHSTFHQVYTIYNLDCK